MNDLLREPQIIKPEADLRGPSFGPRVTAEALLAQLAIVDTELAEARALIGTNTTAREWDQVSSRIERVSRLASQAARFAHTLATRAHTELR